MSSSRRHPWPNRGQLTPAIQRIVIGASMLDQTSSVTAYLSQSVAPFAIGESDSCRIVRVKSSCRRKNSKRRTFDAWGNRTCRRARNVLCPPVQRDGLCAPRYHRPFDRALGDACGCGPGSILIGATAGTMAFAVGQLAIVSNRSPLIRWIVLL